MSPALLLARLAAAAALLLLLQQPHAAAQQQPVWLDSSLTFEQRAQALVGALTLDEKLTQLNSRTAAVPRLNIPAFDYWTGCAHGVADYYWSTGGTMFSMPLGLAATFDTQLMQEVASIMGDEARAKANAAYQANGQTMFTNCFDPNINIFRDPRWGRGAETFGEDPLLTARMVTAYVRGLQYGVGVGPPEAGAGTRARQLSASSARGFLKASATCKHFAAYSLEEDEGITRWGFNAVLDPRDLADTYLPAFEACVREGVGSIMCSYNAINGTPSCANDWLLDATLRKGWGFEGFVVSDCDAVEALSNPLQHAYRATPAEGAAAALRAGTDVACYRYDALRESITQGLVSQQDIDQALVRLFVARLRQGHFDHDPTVNPFANIPPSVVGQPAHINKAIEVVRKGIVLLKNLNRQRTASVLPGASSGPRPTLPLRLTELRNITVVGPLATQSELLLGNYYGPPAGQLLTPFEVVRQRVDRYNAEYQRSVGTNFVRGCDVVGSGADLEFMVEACSLSDVCIFFLGASMVGANRTRVSPTGNPYSGFDVILPATEGEGWDRNDLLLPGEQLSLVQSAAKRTSAMLVVVLLNGGPIDVSWMQNADRVGAILTAWFPGQGAAGIADVLFGDVSPTGRLPVTVYYNNYTSQISNSDMRMRPWPGRTHRFLQVPVLYPFGHGLTFSRVNYTLSVAPGPGNGSTNAAPGSPWLDVDVAVGHTGGQGEEETILLFLSRNQPQGGGDLQQPAALALAGTACQQQEVPADGAPVQNLVGFGRVVLSKGGISTLRLSVTAADLAAFGAPGGGGAAAQPPCGRYWLRAGSAVVAVDVAAPESPAEVASAPAASPEPALAASPEPAPASPPEPAPEASPEIVPVGSPEPALAAASASVSLPA